MKTTTTIESLKTKATSVIEFATKEIAEFAADLSKDPGHALEWSSKAFEAAGRIEVWSRVRAWVTPTSREVDGPEAARIISIDEVKEEAGKEVHRRAIYPSHSTSAPSNMMDECRLVAWASVVEWLNGGW